MGDVLIPVLAAAVPLALTILGARMSWMKERPCMIWIYVALGFAGLCVIGWQGCRNKQARDRAEAERLKSEEEAMRDREESKRDRSALLAKQDRMLEGMAKLQSEMNAVVGLIPRGTTQQEAASRVDKA